MRHNSNYGELYGLYAQFQKLNSSILNIFSEDPLSILDTKIYLKLNYIKIIFIPS